MLDTRNPALGALLWRKQANLNNNHHSEVTSKAKHKKIVAKLECDTLTFFYDDSLWFTKSLQQGGLSSRRVIAIGTPSVFRDHCRQIVKSILHANTASRTRVGSVTSPRFVAWSVSWCATCSCFSCIFCASVRTGLPYNIFVLAAPAAKSAAAFLKLRFIFLGVFVDPDSDVLGVVVIHAADSGVVVGNGGVVGCEEANFWVVFPLLNVD